MTQLRSRTIAIALLAMPAALSAQAKEKGKLNEYGNPMKIPPRPTSAAISETDLRTRLYIFADDSMLGRQINTLGNMKGTNYIASEVKRLGLEPAGDNGTYFQTLPFSARYYASTSQVTTDNGQTLRWGEDVVPGAGAVANANFAGVQVIYGGVAGDTATEIAANRAVGRFVILTAAPGSGTVAAGGDGARGGRGGGGARGGGAAGAGGAARGGGRGAGGGGGRGGGRGGAGGGSRWTGAIAVATVDLDDVDPAQRMALTAPPQRPTLQNPGPPPRLGQVLGPADAPPALRITRAAAEQLLGVPLANLPPGAGGRRVSGKFVVAEKPSDHPEYARNVVAILRGSDPALRATYVAIGAHNDHIGMRPVPVDHDSLEAYNKALYAMKMADGKTIRATTQAMRDSAVKMVNMAEIRKKHGPARMDSVSNGADDDGSGSMAVLEIAEALSMAPEKPKRSIIFVWHSGEESGLQGSSYFTNHPTVPRDSIVAQINIDMIGRGRVDDLPGGGPDYLGVVGSNRLSADLSKLVTQANAKQKKPLSLDYEFDDSTAWDGYNNIYGRSDHANYARYNIPIAFFFTGLHRDYHQLTDEPQYIDYPHYSRITNYIRDLMVDVGNAPRPRLDKGAAQ